MTADCPRQLTLWDLGPQQVTVDFQGGTLVTDAGLLALRALDRDLGVVAGLAWPPACPIRATNASSPRRAKRS